MAHSVAEAIIFLVVIAAIPAVVRWRILEPVERFGRRLARRPRVACVSVFLLSIGVAAGTAVATRMPIPVVQDEFSYLLAADTFAHHRVTNPTPTLWKSFETFHVLMSPTRQSKFPPGQGLSMALGQVATGLPIVGVWLTTALASAAIFWMLIAWMPARWALLGGFLAALHPIVFKWSQSFWGGSLPLLGGALVVGGLRRCVDHGRLRDGLALGAGAAILACSRPYEGAVVAAFAVAVVAVDAVRRRVAGARVGRMAAGAAIVLLPALAFVGYYNMRVTGSALRMPYAVYEQQYGVVPVFLFEKMRPMPPIANAPMREMITDYNVDLYRGQVGSASGFVSFAIAKLQVMSRWAFQSFDLNSFLLDPFFPIHNSIVDGLKFTMAIPMLALPFLLRRYRWAKVAAAGVGVGIASILAETWLNTHYTAPSAPFLMVLAVFCLRAVWVTRVGGRPVGRSLVRTLVLLYVAAFCVNERQYAAARPYRFAAERVATQQRLSRTPGSHLVIVRYLPGHEWGREVVYNDADIDHAKVVWAREMDPAQNRRLLDYFHGRAVWLYEPDRRPALLEPYRLP